MGSSFMNSLDAIDKATGIPAPIALSRYMPRSGVRPPVTMGSAPNSFGPDPNAANSQTLGSGNLTSDILATEQPMQPPSKVSNSNSSSATNNYYYSMTGGSPAATTTKPATPTPTPVNQSWSPVGSSGTPTSGPDNSTIPGYSQVWPPVESPAPSAPTEGAPSTIYFPPNDPSGAPVGDPSNAPGSTPPPEAYPGYGGGGGDPPPIDGSFDDNARGQVITKPTLARIGEKGPEAVVPLTPRAGNRMQPDMLEGHITPQKVPGVRYSRYSGYNRFGRG